MVTGGSDSDVLLVVADCPKHFVELAYRFADELRSRGHRPMFAVTTPFYERFNNVSLAELGPVCYISEYASANADADVSHVDLNYWLTHATYTRMRYIRGRHENDWDMYRRVVLFYRDLFDKNPGIRAVWSEPPTNATISIAAAEAERRSISFFGYICARVPGHFNVVDDVEGIRLLANADPAAATQPPDGAPDYMKSARELVERSALSVLRESSGRLWSSLKSRTSRSIEIGDPTSYQIRSIGRQIYNQFYYRVMRPERGLLSELPLGPSGDKAILFPLQFRPEASTSVQARFHESDIETIRNIAFSLPHRTFLYVKEHPSALGRHSRAFFRDIVSLPNVRLLGSEPTAISLLDRFDAVICLTSTVGFEASQRGIPVYLLGRTFFESYPGVVRVESWRQLERELSTLVRPKERKNDGAAMTRYMGCCFAGNFDCRDEAVLAPENIRLLVVPIQQHLSGVSQPSA